MSKGSIGGGVNISHKSKMSQSAKNQMSFPGGMPGPGDYGKVVGKGMAKYLSGESVGMKKYGRSLHEERVSGMKSLAGYLEDTQEELMDAVVYIQTAKEQLKHLGLVEMEKAEFLMRRDSYEKGL